jgi:hypothetical protein
MIIITLLENLSIGHSSDVGIGLNRNDPPSLRPWGTIPRGRAMNPSPYPLGSEISLELSFKTRCFP